MIHERARISRSCLRYSCLCWSSHLELEDRVQLPLPTPEVHLAGMKILMQMVTVAMKLKDACSLEEKL